MTGVVSDEQLLERFRGAGDVAALGALFDRTAPALLRVAAHLARDPAGAEDLVQSAFLRAIEARDGWDGRRPVLPWLLGILHNRARQARRREERRPDPARLEARTPPDPASAAEDAEFDAAVAELPAAYRPVLRLHLAYGHAPAEIAHALERPPATVRSQLARGLERLRRRLPLGFAGLVAACLSGGRGLAAVRAAVLDRAAAAAPASAVGKGIFGALAMKAKLASLAAALIVLVAGVWFSRPPTERHGARAEVGEPPHAGRTLARRSSARIEQRSSASERAASSPAPAETTGALRVTCRWSDGSPASEVLITVGPPGSPYDGLDPRSARTGADGTVLVDDLPPGSSRIAAERGGATTAEVALGATTEVELTIPAGLLLRGRVVDGSGAAVPSARVWLSLAAHDFDRGQHVATAGADGRFELRSVEPERFVSAVAPRLRAATVQPVRGEPGDEVELELVLDGVGATLVGSVSGADGRGVSGARVLVGEPDVSHMRWSPAVHGRYRPPADVATDERGRFRVDGLQPGGEVPVWVRASGHCAWTRRVELLEPGETTLVVRLTRGARIEGRVTDEAGIPLGGALVMYRHGDWIREKDDVAAVMRPTWACEPAVTAPDGRYALEHVPPGPIRLVALSAGREARGRVEVADGSRTTWDAVLAERAIRGRVLDAYGAPLAGVAVTCTPPPGRGRAVETATGADGRFRCGGLASEPHALRFFGPDDALRARPAATVWRVMPDGEEVTVRLSDAALASASITGRLLDVDGRPPAAACVCFSAEGTAELTADVDPDSGRFQIGPLPPGEYRAQARWGEPLRFAAWSEPFVLLPREERDLGVLELVEPGAVAVRVLDAAGEPIDGARVAVEHDDGWSAFLAEEVETVHGDALLRDVAPGRYRVALRGDSRLPDLFAPVTVRSGEETALELRVPPSVACRIVLLPPTEPLPIEETFVWRRDGVFQEHWRNRWESGNEAALTRRLVPGEWEVEITSESGAQARTRFRVDLSEPAPPTIRVALP